MKRKVRLFSAMGMAAAAFCALPASAQHFANEAAWQVAAGSFNQENFDSLAIGTQLNSLVGLGIDFSRLSDNTSHPSVQTNDSGFGGDNHSPNNVLFNAVAPVLPGLGPIVLTPIDSKKKILAVGYWNTGHDDTTLLTFRDSANNLLDSVESGKENAFNGIVLAGGASSVVIEAGSQGNGFFSIDNLQVTLVAVDTKVPEPGSLALLTGTVGIAFDLRRRRRNR